MVSGLILMLVCMSAVLDIGIVGISADSLCCVWTVGAEVFDLQKKNVK